MSVNKQVTGCPCKDYQKTVPILNDMLAERELVRNRGPYQGVPMKYCAWCGEKLPK